MAEKTEIVIDVGGYEEFTLKGTVIIEKGWTKYDDYNQRDKILPKLNKGDSVNICFKPAEKETVPPKHYTIETLNNYLKNPFREEKANAAKEESGAQNTGGEDESDDIDDYRAVFEGLELGTEATRTGIINNAITSKYIALKKDVYTILPGGEFLIESLGRMNISMDKYKTSEMGQALKKVYKGNMSVEESVEIAKREIGDVFKKKKVRPEIDTDNGIMGQVIGKCPYCGENFVRTKFGYGCSGYKNGCKFSVSAVICGRVISVSNMKLALENGKTSRIEGFVSKNGKSFDATMKLENRKLVFVFNIGRDL